MENIYKKISDQNLAMKSINGTSRAGQILDATYNELVSIFGEPTFSEPSGDSKVQKEWVFMNMSTKQVFTVYDWKTFDENFTVNKLKVWNVGSKGAADEFISWVMSKIRNTRLDSSKNVTNPTTDLPSDENV